MPFDLISRKSTHFVLWSPRTVLNAPVLIIGQFQQGNPPSLALAKRFTMTPAAGVTGLWEIAATSCGLVDGSVYHYWFAVQSTNPNRPGGDISCTDPTAWAVDWRLLPPPLAPPFIDEDRQPAAVVLFREGLLQPSDPGGEQLNLSDDPLANTLPPNNQLVIYELPTAWARTATGSVGIGTGSFQDVRALIEPGATGKNLSDLAVTAAETTYLTDLGINALELLPPADSFFKREWGYDTAHYLAADSELGQPDGNSWPTANRDLSDLVKACHQQRIRFFVDMVMAFSRNEAYQHVAFDQFCIEDPAHNQGESRRTHIPLEPRESTGQRRFWEHALPLHSPTHRFLLRPRIWRGPADVGSCPPTHVHPTRPLDDRLSHRRHSHRQRRECS